MDIREKIKSRVRKLLNLAGDDGAFDGEIAAAMQAAESLMEQYQLDRADCEAAEVAQGHAPQNMGQANAATHGKNLTTWESMLAEAVCELVGTVRCYATRGERSVGAFGAKHWGARMVFYGPDDDARLASELFAEWTAAIATLATGKYGGFARGDGGMYAMGFSSALCGRARENRRQRAQIVTAATTALVLTGSDRSLAALQNQTRNEARNWLARDMKIHLRTSSRRSGYGSGSRDAYAEGRSDGTRADFGAKRNARLM